MGASQVREIFDYDPETGKIWWKINVSRWKAGEAAGRQTVKKGKKRYIEVRFEGRWYLGHRIAVAWMTGEWPKELTDHWNGDGFDNRWENIRQATHGQNSQNRKTPVTNKLGLKGVIKVTRFGVTKFEARIRVGGKQIHLGRFETARDASRAYAAAADKHFGDFARTH